MVNSLGVPLVFPCCSLGKLPLVPVRRRFEVKGNARIRAAVLRLSLFHEVLLFHEGVFCSAKFRA
jgi:hypothetical protein